MKLKKKKMTENNLNNNNLLNIINKKIINRTTLLTYEYLENIVKICQNDVLESKYNSLIKISKLISTLAYFSCSEITLNKINKGNYLTLIFTIEEKNLFARLQIQCNEIRKNLNLNQLPLLSLSPNLVLAVDNNLILELQSNELKKEHKEHKECKECKEHIEIKEKKIKTIKTTKNNKNIKGNEVKEIKEIKEVKECNNQENMNEKSEVKLTEMTSNNRSDPISVVKSESDADIKQEDEPVDTSPKKKKVVEDIPDSKIFFYDEVDPNDNEGWISVSSSQNQNQNREQKNKVKVNSKLDKRNIKLPQKPNEIKKNQHQTIQKKYHQPLTLETPPSSIIENSIQSSKLSNNDNDINSNNQSENSQNDKIESQNNNNDNNNNTPGKIDENDNSMTTQKDKSISPKLNGNCSNCMKLEKKVVELTTQYTNKYSEMEFQHQEEINELHRHYKEEINELRELHSQALQSIHLKLYIALTNLENERENRNKIIEDSLLKYYQNMNHLS